MLAAGAPSRQDVVDAARAVLEEGGPDALSMRRLAAEVGVSYQVVYSRVGNKLDVVRALHAEGFRLLVEAVDTLPEAPGTDAHLRAMATGYLDFAVGHRQLFDVMFASPVPGLARDGAVREVERQAFRTCWVGATRQWFDAQHPDRPSGSARRLAWRLWTAVHGITVLYLAGHDSLSGDVHGEINGLVDVLVGDPVRP